MSFIFEDGYIINPYNGDSSYMGEDVFKAAYKEPIKSQITIQEF